MGLYDRDYMRSTPGKRWIPNKNETNPYNESNEELDWFPRVLLYVGGLYSAALLSARVGSFSGIYTTPWINENRWWFCYWIGYPDVFLSFFSAFAVIMLFGRLKDLKGLHLVGEIALLLFGIIVFLFTSSCFCPDLVSAKTLWRGKDWESAYKNVFNGRAIVCKPNDKAVLLENNPKAKNPSFAELVDFLAKDKTDAVEYVSGEFVCASFAEMLHNNAESCGVRCGYVCVEFVANLQTADENARHALNVFNTTDQGMVFIDSTGHSAAQKSKFQFGFSGRCDRLVKLEVGKSYEPTYLFLKQYQCTGMGTVKAYKINW